MKDEAKKRWYSLSGFILQFPFAALLVYWFWEWPSHLEPGYAVAILGVAAAIMAVRADRFTRVETSVWIILSVALCVLELRTIRHDREVAASELKDARSHEEQNFRAIGAGIKNTIEQGQEQFAATMRKSEKLIGDVGDSMMMQTGGDSFAFITLTGPQPPMLTVNDISHPLNPWLLVSITSHGKYPLRNIRAILMDDERRMAAVEEYNKHPGGDWVGAIQSADITYQYPYLRPQSPEAPSGDVEAIGAYPIPKGTRKRMSIAFSSLNGYWNETLHLGLVNREWHQCLSVLGPTVRQSTEPFIWCDADWPEGKALAQKDWAGLKRAMRQR